MFLEHLPTDVQTILASGSEDLSVSGLAEMANMMLDVQWFQPPSIAQLFLSSLQIPNEHLVTQMADMTAEMDSLKLQLEHLTSQRSSRHSPSRRRHTRYLELLMSVVIIPISVKRPIVALPLVPSIPHRETSLSPNTTLGD
ncbi:unnamed protein product [Schistocephalus solidus]|uniref:CUE domain-containing protein n=1 Tax=Schistocephalus solidus TaxID=70667 RepID=A0A183T1H6_SCHSO|nr:unnamed protein product [Schistocephalus solidus]